MIRQDQQTWELVWYRGASLDTPDGNTLARQVASPPASPSILKPASPEGPGTYRTLWVRWCMR